MFSQTPGLLLTLASVVPSLASSVPAILKVSDADWRSLNASVGGRLHVLKPLAEPCYLNYDSNGVETPHTPDLKSCKVAQDNRRNIDFITGHPAAYHDAFYGTCMTEGNGCPLTNLPANATDEPLSGTCHQGRVPDYYIDVREVSDIQAGLTFAEDQDVPLVVTNTGHDYRGRSSGAHSLSLWTHNLQPPIQLDEDFKPDMCGETVGPAITYGAGQGFAGIYDFVHENGYMALGGACPTVGASGGFITGGGHSVLSPVHGLGVDNAMQIKAVLPNGTYVTANRCQNQDIFFALRGGGGGTFGVITETTARVFPEVPLQVGVISFKAPFTEVTPLLLNNSVKWVEDGWGGYISPLDAESGFALMINPKLTREEAIKSMKPLIDFALPRNDGTLAFGVEVTTVDNYREYLRLPAVELIGGLVDGISIIQSSRLVPKENFATEEKREELADALSEVRYGALMVTPYGYDLPESDRPGGPGEASVTPAWRDAIWHVTSQISFDAKDQQEHTPEFFTEQFQKTTGLLKSLREITPNGGAYQNEADPYEPDHIGSFWGQENYDRLLKIKKEIDPKNIMTCHNCVGADLDDSRLSCYPRL